MIYIDVAHIVRSSGSILRKNLNEMVTPEAVRENWEAITDMSEAKHFISIGVCY